MFQQLLREESICVGLKAENQKSAFKQLIDAIPAELSADQKEQLLNSLMAREKFGTTAIGDGVALPRAVSTDVSLPVAILGINREGIPFPSLDGSPVFIIFLLIWPDREERARERQQVLQNAENFFRDSFLRERIKIALNPEEVYEILLREGSQFREANSRVPLYQAVLD